MFKSDIIAFLHRPENNKRDVPLYEVRNFLLLYHYRLIDMDIQQLCDDGYIERKQESITLLPQKV